MSDTEEPEDDPADEDWISGEGDDYDEEVAHTRPSWWRRHPTPLEGGLVVLIAAIVGALFIWGPLSGSASIPQLSPNQGFLGAGTENVWFVQWTAAGNRLTAVVHYFNGCGRTKEWTGKGTTSGNSVHLRDVQQGQDKLRLLDSKGRGSEIEREALPERYGSVSLPVEIGDHRPVQVGREEGDLPLTYTHYAQTSTERGPLTVCRWRCVPCTLRRCRGSSAPNSRRMCPDSGQART